jgi:hypothetical protein
MTFAHDVALVIDAAKVVPAKSLATATVCAYFEDVGLFDVAVTF